MPSGKWESELIISSSVLSVVVLKKINPCLELKTDKTQREGRWGVKIRKKYGKKCGEEVQTGSCASLEKGLPSNVCNGSDSKLTRI